MKTRTLLAWALCILTLSTAQAQVHRCTTASGSTVYSDAPCSEGQTGSLIERQKSAAEIAQERAQADAATERKYREQAANRQQQERSPAQGQALNSTPASRASTEACKSAQKELEFVTSIRTLSQDEKRLRANAAITQVNAACGTNTPLMQEPPKIVVSPHPVITRCEKGFCYDDAGAIYRQSAENVITAPDGRSCTRSGAVWNCS